MSYQDLEKNLHRFQELIDKLPATNDQALNVLRKHYMEQNISLLNDLLLVSLEHLNRLKKIKSKNDIICTQARLIKEIHGKIAIINRRFLDISLGQIADYNEWLETHCDLSTD